MKYDKFFELAKAAGIEDCELYISESSDLSFHLFHGEVTQYENDNAKNITARGIINGKFGSATCDTWDNKRAEYLVNEIKSNALVSENDDPAIIFAGSPKYKKVSTYNKELETIPFDVKLNKMLDLWIQTLFISVCIYLIAGKAGVIKGFTWDSFLASFLPITTNSYWFITTYFVFLAMLEIRSF